MQDRELVDAVLNGDKLAQREFYDRHVDRVFGLSLRMTGHEAAAKDCTQTTFIRLFDKLRSFRGEAALSTWIHAVAVSVVLEWRRKTARRTEREVCLESIVEIAADEEQVVRDGAVTDAIRQAIDTLSSRYQAVFVMHDIEGYTHAEIAAALGIRAGTSKVRLGRARKMLREALAEFAGELAHEQ